MAALATILVAPIVALAQSARVEQVAWLAGCWEMIAQQRVVQEQWTKPAGQTMLGVGRTVRDGKTIEHEFVVIIHDAPIVTVTLSASQTRSQNLGQDWNQPAGGRGAGAGATGANANTPATPAQTRSRLEHDHIRRAAQYASHSEHRRSALSAFRRDQRDKR